MANLQETIDVIFAGKDHVSDVMDKIGKGFNKFDAAVQSMAQPLSDAADSVLKIDTALVVLALGGLTYAFLKSKDYESAIIDLEKVMGESEKVTADLELQFTSLSRTYGESSIAIVNALAGLRQSGYDTSDAMIVLETSLKLARASELSSEEATNLLKRSMIGYNIKLFQAGIATKKVGSFQGHFQTSY